MVFVVIHKQRMRSAECVFKDQIQDAKCTDLWYYFTLSEISNGYLFSINQVEVLGWCCYQLAVTFKIVCLVDHLFSLQLECGCCLARYVGKVSVSPYPLISREIDWVSIGESRVNWASLVKLVLHWLWIFDAFKKIHLGQFQSK